MAFALQAHHGLQDRCLAPRNVRRRYIRAPKTVDDNPLLGSRGAAPPSAASIGLQHTQQSQWEDEQECIEIDATFEAAEGAKLSKELEVAKHCGSGSTADVYKLKRTGGNRKGADLVLKMSKPVPGLRRGFQREWMLGRRLNAVAAQVKELDMLIHTGPAVVSKDEKGNTVFRGAVLEGINGKSLDKRLQDDTTFCDVDFLIIMLQQVLTCLNKAHTLVGFTHGDLRISNIMEHVQDSKAYEELLQHPETWQKQGYESAASAALDQGALTFRILDFGHSKIHERRARSYLKLSPPYNSTADTTSHSECGGLALQHLPHRQGFIEAFYRFWYRGKSDAWRLLRSLATRLDGRAWPQRKQKKVLALYKLMEDVLYLKLQARFFQDEVRATDGTMQRVGSTDEVFDEAGGGYVQMKELVVLDVTAKPRRWKLLRALREKVLRWWSRLFSRKPMASAKEVLKRMQELGLTAQ